MQNITPFPQQAAGSSEATTASSPWLPVSRQVMSESTSAPPEYLRHSSYTSLNSVHLEERSSLRTQGSLEAPTSSMRETTLAQHYPSVADFQHVQNICPVSYPSPPRTCCCSSSCSCTHGTRAIASVIRHHSAATHDACRGCATSL